VMGFFSATGQGSEMGLQYLSRKFLLNFCIHNYVFLVILGVFKLPVHAFACN